MDFFKRYFESKVLAGAVTAVATPREILAVEAEGFADVAAGRPMERDSFFWIASMTKPITGTLLMMLVDEGKVRIEDPVEKYLPEFKGQMVIAEKSEDRVVLRKPVHPITIWNVMTHTSGLPFISPIEQPTRDVNPLRIAALSYGALHLDFEPGTQHVYSNAGINTAARIIEVVAGMPYELFLQERLLGPLGMTETTFWPSEAQVKRLARTYAAGWKETVTEHLRYPLTDRSRYPVPAGGLFSTVDDMLRFGQMIMNGGTWQGRRYLSESAVREMTKRHTPAGMEGRGLGWQADEGWSGHGGALATDFKIFHGPKLLTVILVQYSGPWEEVGKFRADFEQEALKKFGK